MYFSGRVNRHWNFFSLRRKFEDIKNLQSIIIKEHKCTLSPYSRPEDEDSLRACHRRGCCERILRVQRSELDSKGDTFVGNTKACESSLEPFRHKPNHFNVEAIRWYDRCLFGVYPDCALHFSLKYRNNKPSNLTHIMYQRLNFVLKHVITNKIIF